MKTQNKTKLNLLKIILANILYYSGISRVILRLLLSKKPAHFILMYHRINKDDNGMFRGIAVSDFKKQLKILKRYFSIIKLTDLVSLMSKTKKPLAAITFDDGYKSMFTNAYPILKENDLPATVFITTGAVGNADLLWTDKLNLLKYCDMPENIRIGEKTYAAQQFKDGETLEEIKNYFKKLPDTQRYTELNNLLSQTNIKHNSIPDEEKMLSWDEIILMSKNSIEFGAHTVNHPILSKINKEKAQKEIVESKLKIESMIGKTVNTFCYPNGGKGDFDETTQNILKENGFKCAVTAIEGKTTEADDRLAIKRIALKNGQPGLIVLKLTKELLKNA